jgi:putative endonuclease
MAREKIPFSTGESVTVSTWCVYVLRCGDRTLYTGITNDLDGRLAAHRSGTASKYTRGRQPLRLVYHESHPNRSSASRREAEIKKLPRSAKLALIGRG